MSKKNKIIDAAFAEIADLREGAGYVFGQHITYVKRLEPLERYTPIIDPNDIEQLADGRKSVGNIAETFP